MNKNVVRITENELKRIVNESVNRILTELDWKTYANASRKRYDQYRSNPQDVDKFNKGYELGSYANDRFHDEYVGNWENDTLGDQLRGKHSSTFNAHIDPSIDGERVAYGAVTGYNKNRDKIFSTDKDTYHNHRGISTPGKHFRDREIGDAFTRANDEVWDYAKDNYEYQKA